MYVITASIKLLKKPENDEISGLEEYYREILNKASLQFGGAEIYLCGGKADETK